MSFLKKIDIVNKLTLHLIILQFLMIYFINNAPPFVLLTNINAIIVGMFFLLNNVIHYYNRKASIYSIPFVVLVSFLSTNDFLKYYGAILCFQSMLINWCFFDYFFNKKTLNNHQKFYKNRYFWSSAVGSNFMCAAIDSLSFSLAVNAQNPIFNQLAVIVALSLVFLFFAIMLTNDDKLLRIFSAIFGLSLFISVWHESASPWVDPFAYKLANVICNCLADDQFAWIVDIISTSLFKVIMPTFAWCSLNLYNKKIGEQKNG